MNDDHWEQGGVGHNYVFRNGQDQARAWYRLRRGVYLDEYGNEQQIQYPLQGTPVNNAWFNWVVPNRTRNETQRRNVDISGMFAEDNRRPMIVRRNRRFNRACNEVEMTLNRRMGRALPADAQFMRFL